MARDMDARRAWEREYRRRKRAALDPEGLREVRAKEAGRKRRQLADPTKRRSIVWRKGAPVPGHNRWRLRIEAVRERRSDAFVDAVAAHEEWLLGLDEHAAAEGPEGP